MHPDKKRKKVSFTFKDSLTGCQSKFLCGKKRWLPERQRPPGSNPSCTGAALNCFLVSGASSWEHIWHSWLNYERIPTWKNDKKEEEAAWPGGWTSCRTKTFRMSLLQEYLGNFDKGSTFWQTAHFFPWLIICLYKIFLK